MFIFTLIKIIIFITILYFTISKSIVLYLNNFYKNSHQIIDFLRTDQIKQSEKIDPELLVDNYYKRVNNLNSELPTNLKVEGFVDQTSTLEPTLQPTYEPTKDPKIENLEKQKEILERKQRLNAIYQLKQGWIELGKFWESNGGQILRWGMPSLLILGYYSDLSDLYSMVKKSYQSKNVVKGMQLTVDSIDTSVDILTKADGGAKVLTEWKNFKNILNNFSGRMSYASAMDDLYDASKRLNESIGAMKDLSKGNQEVIKVLDSMSNIDKSDDFFKLAKLSDAGSWNETIRFLKFRKSEKITKNLVNTVDDLIGSINDTSKIISNLDNPKLLTKFNDFSEGMNEFSKSVTKFNDLDETVKTASWYKSWFKGGDIGSKSKSLNDIGKVAKNQNKLAKELIEEIDKLDDATKASKSVQTMLKQAEDVRDFFRGSNMTDLVEVNEFSKLASKSDKVDDAGRLIRQTESTTDFMKDNASIAKTVDELKNAGLSDEIAKSLANDPAKLNKIGENAEALADLKNTLKQTVPNMGEIAKESSDALANIGEETVTKMSKEGIKNASDLNETLAKSGDQLTQTIKDPRAAKIIGDSGAEVGTEVVDSVITKGIQQTNISVDAGKMTNSADNAFGAAQDASRISNQAETISDISKSVKLGAEAAETATDTAKALSIGAKTMKMGKSMARIMSKYSFVFTLIGAAVCFGFANANENTTDQEKTEDNIACGIQLAADLVVDAMIQSGTKALALAGGVFAAALIAFMITTAVMDAVDECVYNRFPFTNASIAGFMSKIYQTEREQVVKQITDGVQTQLNKQLDNFTKKINDKYYQKLKFLFPDSTNDDFITNENGEPVYPYLDEAKKNNFIKMAEERGYQLFIDNIRKKIENEYNKEVWLKMYDYDNQDCNAKVDIPKFGVKPIISKKWVECNFKKIVDNLIESYVLNISNIYNSLTTDVDETFKNIYGVDKETFIKMHVTAQITSYKYASPMEFGQSPGQLNLTEFDKRMYIQYMEEYFNINKIYVPDLTDQDMIDIFRRNRLKGLKAAQRFMTTMKNLEIIAVFEKNLAIQQYKDLKALYQLQQIRSAQTTGSLIDDIKTINLKKRIDEQKRKNLARLELQKRKINRLKAITEARDERNKKVIEDIVKFKKVTDAQNNNELLEAINENKTMLEKLAKFKKTGKVTIDKNNNQNDGNVYSDVVSNNDPSLTGIILYLSAGFVITIVSFLLINFILNKIFNR